MSNSQVGAPGASGAAGTPGAAGQPGAKGDQGVTGATGAAGAEGATGAAGAHGATGTAGHTGATGSSIALVAEFHELFDGLQKRLRLLAITLLALVVGFVVVGLAALGLFGQVHKNSVNDNTNTQMQIQTLACTVFGSFTGADAQTPIVKQILTKYDCKDFHPAPTGQRTP